MLSTPPALKRRVSQTFTEESLTEQCHKDEVSIHAIMHRYKEHGVITHVNKYEGTYGDFISAPDFQEAQNMIAEAASMFETVPSHIRDDFDNDPQKFLAFIQDPEQREAIEEYGLDASHLPLPDDSPTPTPTPRKRKAAPEPPTEPSDEDS